jgi:hypothetical protein
MQAQEGAQLPSDQAKDKNWIVGVSRSGSSREVHTRGMDLGHQIWRG